MEDYDKKDVKARMDKAVEALARELGGLSTGRANVRILDPVQVHAYGAIMPLAQVGTVSAPEARLLTVQVWDAGLVKAVEKAISDAGLGLNPQPDGALIRIPVPDLNAERRAELVKVAGKYAEAARVAIRGVRRDAMEAVKAAQKAKAISEDDQKRLEGEIQDLTDAAVAEVDKALAAKEKDITTV
ncbi:MAG TPA: ribosome recycling factor [Rhodospirillaceae bacterium]|jgi:ribosome recycling factor|nr:ribosome recycling factor [Alphaproteobacteria bacterium]HBH26160.1 ribosome recycling factor [Rhodospirillaceae bacterium]